MCLCACDCNQTPSESLAHYSIELIFTLKPYMWTTENSVGIVWENQADLSAGVSGLRARYNAPDSPISNPLMLFATQICAWGRYGNFADCRTKVRV